MLDQVLANTGLLRGDFDGNGTVDFPDFLTLSTNFGTDVESYTLGDIDGDGSVGFTDFLALSANFGQSTTAAATVPEPCGLGQVAFSLIALLGVANRRLGRQSRSA